MIEIDPSSMPMVLMSLQSMSLIMLSQSQLATRKSCPEIMLIKLKLSWLSKK